MIIIYCNNLFLLLEYFCFYLIIIIGVIIIKKLFFITFFTFLIGVIPSLLVGNNVDYLRLPLFYPPKILFPIIWSVLYLIMSYSAYLVSKKDDSLLILYFVHLIINSLWTVIFFGLKLRLFAFVWLITLFFVVIYMMIKFYKYSKLSSYLLIPYSLWIMFAGYLNLSIYLLNR